MITKEQAMSHKQFKQTKGYDSQGNVIELDKPINWRANGKCKTWKTRPDDFHLPVKHGLQTYGYITQDNADMLEIA